MITIGINGFTRTARSFLRLLCDEPEHSQAITVSLINIGPGDVASILHVFKYDALLGTYPLPVHLEGDFLCIGKRKIRVCAQPDPKKIDWVGHGISWVVETTGMCVSQEDMHMFPGARLLLAYPADEITNIPVVRGLPQEYDDNEVISIGASYDQALVSLLHHIDSWWGIVQGVVTVFDPYTYDYLPEGAFKDSADCTLASVRRCASRVIFPSGVRSTQALHLAGYKNVAVTRFSLPLERSSLVDCTLVLRDAIDLQVVIKKLKLIVVNDLQKVIGWSDDPVASSDVIDSQFALMIDGTLVAVQGNILKLYGWYDAVISTAVSLRNVLKDVSNRADDKE